MKRLLKNIPFIVTLIVFVLTISIILVKSINYYNEKEIPYSKSCNEENNNEINDFIIFNDTEADSIKFDYRNYYIKGNYCEYNALVNDIEIIDSIFENYYSFTEPFIYNLLSDSMINNELVSYDSKYILKKLDWIRSMKFYSKINKKYKYLFSGIYDRWMQSIVWTLSKELKDNNILKYDYNFKIIAAQCKLEGYYVPQKKSGFEKAVDYFSDGRYTYILNRLSSEINIYYLTFLIIIFAFNIFCVYFTLKNVIKTKVKQ